MLEKYSDKTNGPVNQTNGQTNEINQGLMNIGMNLFLLMCLMVGSVGVNFMTQ